MRRARLPSQLRVRRIVGTLILCWASLWCLFRRSSRHMSLTELERKYPLLWRHVHTFNGTGGAWYIPPKWPISFNHLRHTILDAAHLVSASTTENNRTIPHSSIPLLLHQTWKTRRIDTWTDLLRESVEKWLTHVVANDMAYFFWEDDGIMRFLAEFEPHFVDRYMSLPANIERPDVFRILVLKWFGGIYTDIDTQPLRAPSSWISASDLSPWVDPATAIVYDNNFTADSNSERGLDHHVNLLLGIEADCSPDTSTYWRMGYSLPIQLTQWTLASSPSHPVLFRFIDTLTRRLQAIADRHDGVLTSVSAIKELRQIGPLPLTGPVALTLTVKAWLEEKTGLRWNALTGLYDGGKSKLVEGVLILPITGFSPGRGQLYGNMGSRPVTHPSARVWHQAQGSWRSFHPKAEFGKFCRTFFGLCRKQDQ